MGSFSQAPVAAGGRRLWGGWRGQGWELDVIWILETSAEAAQYGTLVTPLSDS